MRKFNLTRRSIIMHFGWKIRLLGNFVEKSRSGSRQLNGRHESTYLLGWSKMYRMKKSRWPTQDGMSTEGVSPEKLMMVDASIEGIMPEEFRKADTIWRVSYDFSKRASPFRPPWVLREVTFKSPAWMSLVRRRRFGRPRIHAIFHPSVQWSNLSITDEHKEQHDSLRRIHQVEHNPQVTVLKDGADES